MTSVILFILLVILTIVIYIAVKKYAPVYVFRESKTQNEIEEIELYSESNQAFVDLQHFQNTKTQYEQLRQTINEEIAAVKEYRYKKLTVLPLLADNPISYMELASWLTDNNRDFSEKREATLQRQLITVENQIYNCNKRIAKAKNAIAENQITRAAP